MLDADAAVDGAPARRHLRLTTAWVVLLIGLVLVPVVASAARIVPDWVPHGDEATIALRGDDLFSAETPLVGMPSTVGASVGEQVHHPGPLESQAIGLVASVSKDPRVPIATTTVVNLVSLVVALLWIRRLGGIAAMAAAGVVVGLLLWSLRGPILVTPYNPYAALLPYLAFLVSLAAAWDRRRWAATSATVFGSWAAQAHLTTSGPVAAAAGAAAVIAVWRWWSIRKSQDGRSALPDRRATITGVAVLAGLWAFPLLDIVVNRGGNAAAVLRASGSLEDSTLGSGRAIDVVTNAVGLRPVWMQAGAAPFELAADPSTAKVTSALLVAVLAVVVAVLCRRSRPAVTGAVAVSAASLVAGGFLTSKIPSTFFTAFATHNYVWLWPASAVLWAATAAGAVHLIAGRVSWRSASAPAFMAGACALASVVVAAASLGAPHRSPGIKESVYARSITEQAEASLDPDGSYLIELAGDVDTYNQGTGLLFALERAGYDVRVPERYEAAFGSDRIASGRHDVLVVHLDREEVPPPAGARTVAVRRPTSDLVERRERAQDDVIAAIERRGGTVLLGGERIGASEARPWVESGGYETALTAWSVEPALGELPATQVLVALREEPIDVVTVHLEPAATRR